MTYLKKLMSASALAAMLLSGGSVFAQVDTGATTTVDTTVTTPGVPDTGMGGEAPMNALILVLSGAMAVGGAVYLGRRLASG